VWVTLIAVTVGAVVTAAAAFSSAGACAGTAGDPVLPPGPADDVCYHLVRSMAERTGVMAAAVTAILVLTMVGLSRMVDQEGPGGTERFP
jgi:hypothetical protein